MIIVNTAAHLKLPIKRSMNVLIDDQNDPYSLEKERKKKEE